MSPRLRAAAAIGAGLAAGILAVLPRAVTGSPQSHVRLAGARWELVGRQGGARERTIDVLKISGGKAAGKLRAQVVVVNRGTAPVQGILLRYALTARLAAKGEAGGVWAVPFMLQERRVPSLSPDKPKQVALLFSPLLEAYLKRVDQLGFAPEELKLQVMVEPHPGEPGPLETLEAQLRVGR